MTDHNLHIKLKEPEKLLYQLLDESLNGIILYTPLRNPQNEIIDLVLEFVNTAAGRILRLPAQELTGKHMLELPSENLSAFFKDLVSVIENNRPFKGIQHFNLKGTECWQELSATPFEGGVLATFYDVTETKATEDRLRRSELLNKKIADLTPGPVLVFNVRTAKYVYVNQALTDMLGYSPNEIMEGGAAFGWSITHPDDLALLAEQGTLMLEESQLYPHLNKTYEAEYRIRKKNGEWIWVNTSTSVFDRSELNEIEHIISVSVNITKQKEAEERLNRLNAELEGRVRERTRELEQTNQDLKNINADLDTFIYTASHDLRSPIVNIQGLTNTIQEIVPPAVAMDPDFAHVMALMNQSILRFKNILSDLADVTKAAKNLAEDIQIQEIEGLIEEISQDMDREIHAANAGIRVDVTECPNIRFSRKNLRSILYNFLSNSIKYRSPERRPEIDITTRCHDGGILIEVRDNGLGIPREYQPKLFSMFNRLHTHVEGSGIGLYIVRRIVENAGGWIEVESEAGKGSLFRVFLKEA